MNLLMVGAGSGSWAMRGQQLGHALGARVTSTPAKADWTWADLVVLVKRYGARYAAAAHAAGVPIVWDALDFWSQPTENTFDEPRARALLQTQLETIRPVLTIGATEAMAAAAGGVYLPHHSWQLLEPMRPQDAVQMVAYEGNPAYLGRWADRLRAACQARKWAFVINPPALWQADILIALRDAQWDGWMCRQWKSGVKLVNAIAAGRPIVTQPSAAVREIDAPVGLVEDPKDLELTLDEIAQVDVRAYAYELCRRAAPAYRLPAIADRYRAILAAVPITRTSCPA
jgi:hypothetical protein